MQPITATDLQESMEKVALNVRPWDPMDFKLERTLQDAIRNHGRVDLMRCREGDGKVAVKRMPNRWIRSGPVEFQEQYPSASERPWCDLGLVRQLNELKYPYVCELLGVFRDDDSTYVVTSLATDGDLFSWCDRDPKPGAAREALMRPIVTQIFSAVRWLHELGVAHRDLSLENILITDAGGGDMKVKIIDFGMGTLSQLCRKEVRGKQSYQSPEMHVEPQYDAFLADGFALGVVLFAMAAQDYPWTSTKRNACQLFEYVSTFGFRRFLEKRKLRKGTGEHLIEVFTPAFADLVEGMLQADPRRRIVLGETCFMQEESRRSVWEMSWLEGAVPDGALAGRAPGGAADRRVSV